MHEYLTLVAVLLLVTQLVGLVRVWRGPTRADRLLAALLFGSTGVAVLLLLAAGTRAAALVDAALALGLLAPVTAAAFVLLVNQPASGQGPDR